MPHRRNKDRLSRERRSWNMSRIRGKDTTPERIVRSLLHRLGYRFRLHVRIPLPLAPIEGEGRGEGAPSGFGFKVPSSEFKQARNPKLGTATAGGEGAKSRKPRSVSVDILLPKYKTAIFVHGCFWHRHRGCKNCTTPTNRRAW